MDIEDGLKSVIGILSVAVSDAVFVIVSDIVSVAVFVILLIISLIEAPFFRLLQISSLFSCNLVNGIFTVIIFTINLYYFFMILYKVNVITV